MYRWKTALLLPLALTLGGCVTYPTYTYRDDVPGREVRYVGESTYYSPSYEGYGDYYSGGYRYGSTGYRYYAPDYISYSAYYSLFWPVNHWYHDPYWYPGFYYGVTYFPRNYFSVSFHSGWRGHSVPRWGYGGAYSIAFGYSHWYSPYRYSWADSYYDWDRYRYQYRDNRRGHGHYAPAHSAPRFGHARNQAERLAWQERERSIPRGDGIATGMGMRAPTVYGNARTPSRGADYGARGEPRSMQSYSPERPHVRQAAARQAWSEPERYRSDAAIEHGDGSDGLRRGMGGRGADADGLPLMRGPGVEGGRPGRGAAVRTHQETPVNRQRTYSDERTAPSMREFRDSSAREPIRVREYSSEPRMQRVQPAREFVPQQRFEPAAPRTEFRSERGGRSADVGARSFSAPEPAPRVERPRDEGFRSGPVESRREAPAPRAGQSHGGGGRGESRARGALQFD